MTLLCRDVFVSQDLDQYGHGPGLGKTHSEQSSDGLIIALSVALVASVMLIYALRGGFQKEGGHGRGRDGDVQFVRVPNNEENLTL